MSQEKQEIKKWAKIIFIALFGYLIVDNISVVGEIIKTILNIMSPFVVGAAIAFILNLPMGFFEEKLSKFKTKKGKKLAKGFIRTVSLILAIVVITLVLTIIVNLILPEIINIITLLIEKLPYYGAEIKNIASNITKDFPQINETIKNIDINDKQLQEQVKNFVTGFLSKSVSLLGNIIGTFFNAIISIVFAAYILTGKDKLKEQAKKILYAYNEKAKAEKIIEIGRTTRNIFRKFITGQCLEALILGLLFLIVMTILGLPYAMLVSVLITFTALIPIFGAFIGCAIGTLLIFMISPVKALIFLVVFLVLQQIEGNFIYPHVVGNSVGLPSIWVLIAVTTGANLMGIVGMLIFIPIMSVVYTLLRGIVNRRLGLKE